MMLTWYSTWIKASWIPFPHQIYALGVNRREDILIFQFFCHVAISWNCPIEVVHQVSWCTGGQQFLTYFSNIITGKAFIHRKLIWKGLVLDPMPFFVEVANRKNGRSSQMFHSHEMDLRDLLQISVCSGLYSREHTPLDVTIPPEEIENVWIKSQKCIKSYQVINSHD